MFYGYNDPNDYWLPPQQNVDPEDAMKLGCSCAIGYVVAFFIAILICALFSSCGSYKKTVKEDTHQTETVTTNTTANSQTQTNATSQSSSVTQNTVTERTDDSTEVVTITETTWYDTSKADSTGNSPVLKTEKTTTIKHNGKRTERQENENRESEQTNALSSTNSSAVIKEESATRDETKSSERNTAATETKQLSYAAWALLALSLLIIVGVLAYWVKSKYRQRG
jgi:H+/gluconate symporter-like permease